MLTKSSKKIMSSISENPILIVLILLALFLLVLCRYDTTFKPYKSEMFATKISPHDLTEPVSSPNTEASPVSSLNNDLLPKSSFNDLVKTGASMDFKSIIGVPSVTDNRNANLQLRSDPTIPHMETGPFNMSTITSENKYSGLDICKST